MKKIKAFVISAFVVAIASAFATQPSKTLVAGDYLSFHNGVSCVVSAGNRPDCTGTNAICTISGKTYYANSNCTTVLRKP